MIIFSGFTITFICRQIIEVMNVNYENEEEISSVCRISKVYWFIKTLSMLCSIMTTALLVYMTAEFSKPLTEYW